MKGELNLKFNEFLENIASQTSVPTNITSGGVETIQQTTRNLWRNQGVEALLEDLKSLYGDSCDAILQTKDGIVFVIEGPNDTTISWELKNTIKALDYDPFEAANAYDDEVAAREAKATAKAAAASARAAMMAEKRAKVIARLAEKK